MKKMSTQMQNTIDKRLYIKNASKTLRKFVNKEKSPPSSGQITQMSSFQSGRESFKSKLEIASKERFIRKRLNLSDQIKEIVDQDRSRKQCSNLMKNFSLKSLHFQNSQSQRWNNSPKQQLIKALPKCKADLNAITIGSPINSSVIHIPREYAKVKGGLQRYPSEKSLFTPVEQKLPQIECLQTVQSVSPKVKLRLVGRVDNFIETEFRTYEKINFDEYRKIKKERTEIDTFAKKITKMDVFNQTEKQKFLRLQTIKKMTRSITSISRQLKHLGASASELIFNDTIPKTSFKDPQSKQFFKYVKKGELNKVLMMLSQNKFLVLQYDNMEQIALH